MGSTLVLILIVVLILVLILILIFVLILILVLILIVGLIARILVVGIFVHVSFLLFRTLTVVFSFRRKNIHQAKEIARPRAVGQ